MSAGQLATQLYSKANMNHTSGKMPHSMQSKAALSQTPESLSPQLVERRERVFFVLAAFFICCMTLLNVVGITRFIQLGPLQLALGVLPYPLTFLCTDLICELYGRARANFVVSVGLGLNAFIFAFMSLGSYLPSVTGAAVPPWQVLQLAESISTPTGATISGSVELFQLLYQCTAGAVFASMIAYITAQYADIKLFHFWKKLTHGKHLWLRNNFSTLVSQGVDSFMVVSITFGALFVAGAMQLSTLLLLMGSNYLFKMTVALADTLPFYFLVSKLSRYLHIDNQSVA